MLYEALTEKILKACFEVSNELKAVKKLASEHMAQLINYLKATGIEIGLLINFGNPKLEYKRFHR